jgi:hypothetical protein
MDKNVVGAGGRHSHTPYPLTFEAHMIFQYGLRFERVFISPFISPFI